MAICSEGCTATHAQRPFAAETASAGTAENRRVRNGWELSVSDFGKTAKKFLAKVGAKLGRVFSFSKPVSKPVISISGPTECFKHENTEILLASALQKSGMPAQGAAEQEVGMPPAKPPRLDPIAAKEPEEIFGSASGQLFGAPAKPPRMDPAEVKRIADREAVNLAAGKPAAVEEPEDIFGSSVDALFAVYLHPQAREYEMPIYAGSAAAIRQKYNTKKAAFRLDALDRLALTREAKSKERYAPLARQIETDAKLMEIDAENARYNALAEKIMERYRSVERIYEFDMTPERARG